MTAVRSALLVVAASAGAAFVRTCVADISLGSVDADVVHRGSEFIDLRTEQRVSDPRDMVVAAGADHIIRRSTRGTIQVRSRVLECET